MKLKLVETEESVNHGMSNSAPVRPQTIQELGNHVH